MTDSRLGICLNLDVVTQELLFLCKFLTPTIQAIELSSISLPKFIPVGSGFPVVDCHIPVFVLDIL